jgi:3-hydroxy acid dehydrogenase/malonic semialdehyde reductase
LKAKLSEDYPNSRVFAVTLDVRNKKQVQEAVASLPAQFKEIDILVNNAGLVIGLDPLETVNEDELNTMLDTNVKGLMFVTQSILPLMKQRPWGAIVNLNSIAGTEAYANGSVYCATKHAVTAITKSLRHELINTPINVISIEPGLVETEFSIVRFRGDKDRADSVYKGLDPLTGQDIAETVCFSTSRAPHVQIASMVVFPTAQAAATTVYRK